MTILDAVCDILKADPAPKSAKALHDAIIAKGLFTFGAKDPVGMVRTTIRRHLREADGGKTKARVKVVGGDLYALA